MTDSQAGTEDQTTQNTSHPRLVLECRPQALYATIYDRLPFPLIAPVQEVAFDLGITAADGSFTLTGLVIRGFANHQLLFEQRWPKRFIQQKTGLDNTEIPEGTGIALRAMHFQLHAYERLTSIELTVVGKSDRNGESRQAVLRVPVTYPELQTDLHFPLADTWWVIQASDWTDLHKREVVSQPYAIDFVKLGPDNQFFRGSGTALEDHESWDQPVYAAAGGKIAYITFDMPDMQPGTIPDALIYRDDPRRILGNAAAISHGNGEFTYYAHLRQASLEVRYGDVIRRGEVLGRVGNSGHSPGPHLHFHVMNGPNLQIDQGLPLKFSNFSAGGQYFEEPIAVPTRMIVTGPERG